MLKNLKIINRLKWLLAFVWKPLLKFEIKIYRNFFSKYNTIQTRLFITTGNISLVNTIALINQLKNEHKKYNDILIISSRGKKDFINRNIELASLHNFKKIIPIFNLRFNTGFILSNLYNIDEIYTVSHPDFLNSIKIYDDVNLNLLDEGCASLINYNLEHLTNLKYFYTHKYLNKLDGIGFSSDVISKISNIDVKEFNKVAEQISAKYPIITPYKKDDKNILYCGIFWEVSGLDRETFAKEQKQLILNLIDAGYKVLYKPHPRDVEFYGLENNPDITFIQSYLPVELYSWDVLAVVSMSSTTSINLAHFSGIPGFSNITESAILEDGTKAKLNICRAMVGEYSPNYKELLRFDVKNLSKEDLKSEIKNTYSEFIANKPLLSQNKNLL